MSGDGGAICTKYRIFDYAQKGMVLRCLDKPAISKHTPFWMRRMSAHNNGIALVLSRTEAGVSSAMKAATDFLFKSPRMRSLCLLPQNQQLKGEPICTRVH